MYETVASCGLSSFVDLFNVRWIFGLQVIIVGGFMEGTHASG
jgi:hypothetical protein